MANRNHKRWRAGESRWKCPAHQRETTELNNKNPIGSEFFPLRAVSLGMEKH